jgi:hypothetical protein
MFLTIFRGVLTFPVFRVTFGAAFQNADRNVTRNTGQESYGFAAFLGFSSASLLAIHAEPAVAEHEADPELMVDLRRFGAVVERAPVFWFGRVDVSVEGVARDFRRLVVTLDGTPLEPASRIADGIPSTSNPTEGLGFMLPPLRSRGGARSRRARDRRVSRSGAVRFGQACRGSCVRSREASPRAPRQRGGVRAGSPSWASAGLLGARERSGRRASSATPFESGEHGVDVKSEDAIARTERGDLP